MKIVMNPVPSFKKANALLKGAYSALILYSLSILAIGVTGGSVIGVHNKTWWFISLLVVASYMVADSGLVLLKGKRIGTTMGILSTLVLSTSVFLIASKHGFKLGDIAYLGYSFFLFVLLLTTSFTLPKRKKADKKKIEPVKDSRPQPKDRLAPKAEREEADMAAARSQAIKAATDKLGPLGGRKAEELVDRVMKGEINMGSITQQIKEKAATEDVDLTTLNREQRRALKKIQEKK
jgi:hypothetical protein